MGFDSIDIVELLSFIEDGYGIEIADIENVLDVIQECNELERWLENKSL